MSFRIVELSSSSKNEVTNAKLKTPTCKRQSPANIPDGLFTHTSEDDLEAARQILRDLVNQMKGLPLSSVKRKHERIREKSVSPKILVFDSLFFLPILCCNSVVFISCKCLLTFHSCSGGLWNA